MNKVSFTRLRRNQARLYTETPNFRLPNCGKEMFVISAIQSFFVVMAAQTQLISSVAGTHTGHLVTHLVQRYTANSQLRPWVQGSPWDWGAEMLTLTHTELQAIS